MAPSKMDSAEETSIVADDGEAVVSIVARRISGGDERVFASITMERDPRRRQETVCVSNAASRAGRRVRLRVVADQSHMEWPADDSELETARLRFQAGTLVLETKLSFPRTCHSGDPPIERAFGSLRANGIIAQLRFVPVSDSEALDAETFSDEKEHFTPRATLAASFRLVDGAITFDEDSVIGRAASSAAGRIAFPLARDVLAAKAPAPRAGRSPDIWDPPPAENAEDAAVLAKRAQRRAEMMKDTPVWRGVETACAPLLARREARLRDLLAVQVRRECALEMASRLRQARFDAAEQADKAEFASSPNAQETRSKATETPVVTESLINEVRDGIVITETPRERIGSRASPANAEELKKNAEAESRSLENAFETLYDLEGFDVDGLVEEAKKCRARHEALVRMVRDLEIDIRDRGRWDAHESGVETRDVLENGVRRADMEKALGRPATKNDVDASMAIPAKERMRIVAGMDVEKARLTGRPEYVAMLPGANGKSFF
jgi:hypothetical protein